MSERRWLPPMGYYARITVTVVAVLVVLSAAWAVRNVLLLVLIAAVLAVGLDPAVRRLQRLKLSRGWAVTAIFLAALAFMGLFAGLVVPPLVREIQNLAEDIPGYVERLRSGGGWLGDLVRRYDLADKLQELVADLPEKIGSSFGAIFGITRSVASLIFNTLTVAILTVYFLLSLPSFRRTADDLIIHDERERTLDEALERIGGYVSGNIIVSVIAGVTSFVFLTILGVPFAAALAMWVAITDLIPTVGAILGAAVAVIVAAFSSTFDAVVTAIYYTAYQQIENYLIVPRVMKRAVDLSPAVVIVSVLIGGSLAGFAGALLALPLAAAIKVVIRDFWLRPRLEAAGAVGEPATEPSA
ncbi:MAG: AI-2E family transporter [Actinobacteria bacterium]|nr:AI-2E family transporter [Actinomycetota bacterium]